jgi:lysophospholipase L1-like esterase
MTRGSICVFVLSLFLPRIVHASTNEFFFRDGDSPIVLLGDSITEQACYSTYLETFILTRYPKWHVTFRNAGWSGDTAWLEARGDFQQALQRDVLALHPRVVTINYGMNDARGGEATYWKYIQHITSLVKACEGAGARVLLITPSPEERDEPSEPGGSAYNRTLFKYSTGLAIVAHKQGVRLVDVLSPFLDVIARGRSSHALGVGRGPCLTGDGIHPGWAGGLVMASIILKDLGAPSLVSSVEIDAAGHQIVRTDKCQAEWSASASHSNDADLSFQRFDEALPWPVHNDSALALRLPSVDPLLDLNRYQLKVTGLTAESYTLEIDDQVVGSFSRESLAAGVTLSLHAGPITSQAHRVFDLVIEKNDLYAVRWRRIQLGQNTTTEEARESELARLDASIATIERQIDELRQPQPHLFRLRPVSSNPSWN